MTDISVLQKTVTKKHISWVKPAKLSRQEKPWTAIFDDFMNQWAVSYASYLSVRFIPQLSKWSERTDMLLQLGSVLQHGLLQMPHSIHSLSTINTYSDILYLDLLF